MDADSISLPATDGFGLAATLFRPERANGRVALIAPAVAVQRHLYDDFAGYLAGSGFTVLTWDWRGTGGSLPGGLRGFDASLSTWARCDLAGAIAWAGSELDPDRLLLIGHSFGGQCVGLAANASDLDGLLTVAATSGYHGHWSGWTRVLLVLLWYTLVPALTRTLGWFPARRLGLGEDLPAGVALEWARWCRSPDYLGAFDGHRAFRAPILAFGFSDDPYAPRPGVDWLHDRYGGPEVTVRHVSPESVGVDRIGHFGFFRDGRVPSLWRESREWLLSV